MNVPSGTFHLGYRPSLDGIRAVAIMLVLLDHGDILGDQFGFIGVDIFFVLSGFLITSLLVSEWEKAGRISLRDFYLRRALRLFPALLAMLAAFGIYVWLTKSGKSLVSDFQEIFWALSYLANWSKALGFSNGYDLGHTWSLGVEEQFYLLWPALLLFLLPRNSRDSLLCWIFFGVVLSVGTRFFLLAAFMTPNSNPDRMNYGLDTRADSLLMGCFSAVLVATGKLPRLLHRPLPSSLLVFVSAAGLLALGLFHPRTTAFIIWGWWLISVFAAILIVQLVISRGTLAHFLMENKIVVYIGQISYGLYLWHAPILIALKRYDLPWQNLIYLAFVVPVVVASYYFIEKPCLDFKRRFQRI